VLSQRGRDGTVLERYEYDAYGKCSILEPNFAPDPDGKSDYDNPYLFTGRRLDILDNSSLKIQYNRNRYYDYYTGRFTTHDPLGYIDGMNLYEYVSSNVVLYLDPSGTSLPDIGIGIGIRIGKRIRNWLLCRAAERAVAALARGHVDEAWRNYTGMSGKRKDPFPVSNSDMKEVFEDFQVRKQIIKPLIEECKNSKEGWDNRRDPLVKLNYGSFGYGESWYPYDGSWGAALGNCRFYPISTCTCRKLSWAISVKEPFDFLPLWKPVSKKPWRVFRNLAVTMTYIMENGCDCGWEPFDYVGEISGEEPIDCSARGDWRGS